jgi:hypothetical protein
MLRVNSARRFRITLFVYGAMWPRVMLFVVGDMRPSVILSASRQCDPVLCFLYVGSVAQCYAFCGLGHAA